MKSSRSKSSSSSTIFFFFAGTSILVSDFFLALFFSEEISFPATIPATVPTAATPTPISVLRGLPLFFGASDTGSLSLVTLRGLPLLLTVVSSETAFDLLLSAEILLGIGYPIISLYILLFFFKTFLVAGDNDLINIPILILSIFELKLLNRLTRFSSLTSSLFKYLMLVYKSTEDSFSAFVVLLISFFTLSLFFSFFAFSETFSDFFFLLSVYISIALLLLFGLDSISYIFFFV